MHRFPVARPDQAGQAGAGFAEDGDVLAPFVDLDLEHAADGGGGGAVQGRLRRGHPRGDRDDQQRSVLGTGGWGQSLVPGPHLEQYAVFVLPC